MKLSLVLFFGACLLLTSIPVSQQYGTIFADTVLPVKGEFTYFSDTTSDRVRTNALDVGAITLADPGGFNVNISQPINFSAEESLSLGGELGFQLGGENTEIVSFTVENDLQFFAEDFFASFSQINFNIPDEVELDTQIEFDSARYASTFANDMFDFDAANLLTTQSANGNLDAFAPNVLGSADHLTVTADDRVYMVSRTGFIDWTAEEGISSTADNIYLTSEQNTEMVADSMLYVHAEDLVEFTSGSTMLSALGTLNFTSERNVDFTSPSGFFINADELNFFAGQEFYLRSEEESISQVVAVAKNRISVQAAETGILGSDDVTFEIFRSQSIISNDLQMTSTDTTSIGSEETSSVNFDAVTNSLTFSVTEVDGKGDEIDFISSVLDFTSGRVDFEADAFVGSTGSSFFDISGSASLTSGGSIVLASITDTNIPASFSSRSFIDVDAQNYAELASFSTMFSAVDIQSTTAGDMNLNSAARTLASAPTISLRGSRTEWLSGETFINAEDILISDNSSGNIPDFSVETLQDQSFYTTSDFTVDSGNDVDFVTSDDLSVSIEGSISMVGFSGVFLQMEDDGDFFIHDTMTVQADDSDIRFINFLDDSREGDFMSFTFGGDVDMTSDVYDINAAGDILYKAGYDILSNSQNDAFFTSDEIVISSLSNRANSGISFTTEESILSTAGEDNIFSGRDVSILANEFLFTTPLIDMRASERFDLVAKDGISLSATETFNVASSGHLVFRSPSNIELASSFGPITFNARDAVNFTSTAGNLDDLIYNGENIFFESKSFDALVSELDAFQENMILSAGNDFPGTIRFSTYDDLRIDNTELVTIDANDIIFSSSQDQSIDAEGDVSVVTELVYISGISMDTFLDENYELQASDISFFSDEFESVFLSVSESLSYLAQESVYVTSDGDISFTTTSFMAIASDVLLFVSDDSVAFDAATTLDLTSNLQSVDISSDGRTAFFSNEDNVSFTSANTFDATAGRIIMDVWNDGASGALFTAQLGDIQMQSEYGSIVYDAALALALNATNTDATASHFFTSTNGVSMSTQQGGIRFNSEGFLAGGNLAFEFISTGNNADIVFDSRLGGINLNTRDDIGYIAGRNMSLSAAYGAEFVPQEYMSFTAPNGHLDVNAQRGITINAGEGLDPADILFTQASGTFNMSAADQITFTSTGAVDGDSILISGMSDIRFHTANTGDIRFVANDRLSFDVAGAFTSTATNNQFFESIAGSISISSVTGADFITEGGPISFQTFSTNPDGAITLTAETQNFEIQSGNSTYLTSEQFGEFKSNTGFLFTSLDGSLDVLASSATSFIELISLGGMQITSSGNNLNPDEGIVMDAANNIEFGTVDTLSIAFNSVENVEIGTFSRPVITFNAAGSESQKGMTITSDGGIQTITQSEFISDIGGDLLIDARVGIQSNNYGDFLMNTVGTQGITFNSNAGVLSLSGDEQFKLTSNTQIVGTTSGILEFLSSGMGDLNLMLWTAPQVEILSGSNQLLLNVLDADLTSSFVLTTTGESVFDSSLDRDGSIEFNAQNSFSASSGNTLDIHTRNRNGPILFETQKTTSSITLTTDAESDIDFVAGGELGIFANRFFATAPEMSFTATEDNQITDDLAGDIQIGAEGNFQASAVEDFDITAEFSVTIETTGTEDDIGGPMFFSATSEITIEATVDTVIRNVANQGGSLNFTATSDITIENDDSSGWISFYADGDLIQNAVRDINLISGGDYSQNTTGSFVVTTDGVDANDDFGIQLESDGSIEFRSLFGGVTFLGNDMTINPDNDFELVTDGDGLFLGNSITLQGSDIDIESTESQVSILSASSTEISALSMDIEANGVDDNGNFGVVFFNGDGSFDVMADSFSSFSDGVLFQAPSIEMMAENNIEFTNVFGDTDILSPFGEISVFADIVSVTSQTDLMKMEAGTIRINAEATVNFDAISDLVVETTGEGASVDIFSSGETVFEGVEFTSRTSRGPNHDLNLIASLARIEFRAQVANADGRGLDFMADHGDLSILALGDDSDIYSDSNSLLFEASNDINFQSVFEDPDTDSVVFNGAADSLSIQRDFLINADDIAVEANQGVLMRALGDGSGGGGSILLSTDNVDVLAETDINFYAVQEGGVITFSSESDILVDGDVEISENAIMKIPSNPIGLNYGTSSCSDTTGAFFWIDNYDYYVGTAEPSNTFGYLCVCEAGTLRCAKFFEPPCRPGDTFC